VGTPDFHSSEAGLSQAEKALLAQLARQFDGVLLQYFRRRIRDAFEAEDLVQEVYFRLIKRGHLGDLQDVRSYLFETASHVLTDRFRKRKSQRADEEQEFDPLLHGGAGLSSDDTLINREALTRVARALLELPERARTAFVLRRLEDLSHEDIAVRLGISVSFVEKLLRRALAYLTQRMDEE
jgi:RNA polymerase sigma factor (sigma-70 family)